MAIFFEGDPVLYDGNDEAVDDRVQPGAVGIVSGSQETDRWGWIYTVDFDGLRQVVLEDHLYSADRSIYKVERVVDTVIVEMDSHVAEQLVAVLNAVDDETSATKTGVFGGELAELCQRLVRDAGIRSPSPLYDSHAKNGALVLTDAK